MQTVIEDAGKVAYTY